ncbi:MAG: bifunctional phosphopantothenoylcysteine decarboxylase/phosphopantothenate--cysteine ligase CoaBC [Gammaproteobacteria bacterium]|nr:MAG: bifunctional phosphopantothenoylcysteine decarboxylase/phosphopantothenate--cysteine ligase CoaBC [Gammaproteobacteria bacterium]
MNMPANKRILLGISGGVAAYKSADLVRRLRERGCEVRVVMTRAACEFITPLTLEAVSGHGVHTEFLDDKAEAALGHIDLARWAELVLVAPATAHTMAKLAHGLADDLLSTICLATTAPIAVAPAMNRQMWQAAATQANLGLLLSRGVTILGPDSGDQACGELGPGRMMEPAAIAEASLALLGGGELDGVSVLVTAGPTREPIDPVRYLSNRSSGKMGYAVAAAAAGAGAQVTMVSGPSSLDTPAGVTRVQITSAEEMYREVMERIAAHQIFVGAAAVADYRPVRAAAEKIKKSDGTPALELVPTQDILAAVSAHNAGVFCVGFAAETENLEKNAEKKLVDKSLDMIAANQVGEGETGFDSDENALLVLWPDGREELPRNNKYQLARELVRLVAQVYREKNSA